MYSQNTIIFFECDHPFIIYASAFFIRVFAIGSDFKNYFFVFGSKKFLACRGSVKSYAWSFSHSDPDQSSVVWINSCSLGPFCLVFCSTSYMWARNKAYHNNQDTLSYFLLTKLYLKALSKVVIYHWFPHSHHIMYS